VLEAAISVSSSKLTIEKAHHPVGHIDNMKFHINVVEADQKRKRKEEDTPK